MKMPGAAGMDSVQVALIISIAAMVVSLVTAGVVVWANAGSRNLALAVGTFAAAAFLFLIQLPFELQRSVIKDRFSTSFTIDRAKPEIRQWAYSSPPSPSMAGWRISIETSASSWLASHNPAAFSGDREKLTADFGLYSLVRFFLAWEFDWQLRTVTYKGSGAAMIITANPISKPNECTTLTDTELTTLLSKAGNSFADAQPKFGAGRVCLPPSSGLEIRERALIVRTPICQISLTVDLAGALSHVKPETGGQTPTLPSGGPQYETRWVGFEVETTYFALRAQHRHSTKYREWCSRVVANAREWFES